MTPETNNIASASIFNLNFWPVAQIMNFSGKDPKNKYFVSVSILCDGLN